MVKHDKQYHIAWQMRQNYLADKFDYDPEKRFVYYARLLDKNVSADGKEKRASVWNKIGKKAQDRFKEISLQLQKSSSYENKNNQGDPYGLSEYLNEVAMAEFNKEKNLLMMLNENNVKSSYSNPEEHIANINKIIGIRERYENLLVEISKTLQKKSSKTKDENENYHGRVNTAFIHLSGRVESIMKEELGKAISNADSIKEIKDNLESIYQKAVDKAIEEISNQDGANYGKSSLKPGEKVNNLDKVYTGLNEWYEENKDNLKFLDYLKDLINPEGLMDEFLTNVKNTRQKLIEEQKEEKRKQKANKEYKIRTYTGFMEEDMGGFFLYKLAKLLESKTIKPDIAHTAISDNMGMTDAIGVISFDADSQEIANYIDQRMSGDKGAATQIEAMTRMNDTVRQLKNSFNKQSNNYLIHYSAKNYSASTLQRGGFAAGGEKPIEQILFVGEQEDIFGPYLTKEELVSMFLSTLKGGILNDGVFDINGIEEGVEALITAFFGRLLFDDYSTVGKGDINSVHLFQLDEILVPLSVVLKAAALAEESTQRKRIISVKLDHSGSVLWPTKPEKGYPNGIEAAWTEQAEDAQQRIKFSIHFLKDFWELLNEQIKMLIPSGKLIPELQ